MKLRDSQPGLKALSQVEFIRQVPWEALMASMESLVGYYTPKISLAGFVSTLGRDEVEYGGGEQQVHCLLPEHGGCDLNRSARYFSANRETGDFEEAIYCYKCGIMLTSFWYVYRYLKEFRGVGFREFFEILLLEYGISFPMDLVLNFEPDTFYSFEKSKGVGIEEKLNFALSLRRTRLEDQEGYRKVLRELWVSGKTGR